MIFDWRGWFFLKKVPSDNCNLISATSSRWLLATESTHMGLSKAVCTSLWPLIHGEHLWTSGKFWTHWNWVCLIYFPTDPNKSQLHPYCWYQHIIYRIKRCWCNIDSNIYHWKGTYVFPLDPIGIPRIHINRASNSCSAMRQGRQNLSEVR